MTRLPPICSIAFVLISSVGLSGQSGNPNSGSWSGVIINSNCSADEAFAEAAKCTEKDVPGAKLALYDDTTRQIYILDPQDQADWSSGRQHDRHWNTRGQYDPRGLFEDAHFHWPRGRSEGACYSRLATSLARQQTLETLKGPKGTVLLFFRSADW